MIVVFVAMVVEVDRVVGVDVEEWWVVAPGML